MPSVSPSQRPKSCLDCGTPITRNATRCGSCAKRFPRESRQYAEVVTDARTVSRFLAKVDKESSDSGCWLWTAYRSADGYGRFGIDHTVRVASNVAYAMFVGPIPDGLYVLHTCDNPPCVNPSHLFLGTLKDNRDDCVRKIRAGRQILTPDMIRAIHEYRSTTGATHRVIAEQFGISPALVCKALAAKVAA